jgi:hypothetical protein
MAVITLCSASGAPGVTTSAIGLAMCWPRPVLLVEADPRGTSAILSGFFAGAREYDAGLVELSYSPLEISDALRDVVRPLAGSVSFVAGTRSHSQAVGLKDLWGRLADALVDLEKTGQDVIVDTGLLGYPGSPEALISLADLTLLVTRTPLPALIAARSWAEQLKGASPSWQQPGLLLVGEGQPYNAREVTRVLDLPVVASIADDPASAAVYYRGASPHRKFAGSPFIRSLRSAVEAIRHTVDRRREDLLREATSS